MMFYDGLADKVRVGEWMNYIEAETDRLNLFLLNNNIDRQTAIENITDDLLSGYYDERRKVNTRSRDCEHRKIMNVYEIAVCEVIAHIRSRIKINYAENYIEKWANRARYFPFEDLMRMDFVEGSFGSSPCRIQKKVRPAKSLADFLTVEGKQALIDRIGGIIRDAKAKKIATIIRALTRMGQINFTTGECTSLCYALTAEYGVEIDVKGVLRYLPSGGRGLAITLSDEDAIISLLTA